MPRRGPALLAQVRSCTLCAAQLPLPVALCALFLPGDFIKAVIAAAVTATVARMRPVVPAGIVTVELKVACFASPEASTHLLSMRVPPISAMLCQ